MFCECFSLCHRALHPFLPLHAGDFVEAATPVLRCTMCCEPGSFAGRFKQCYCFAAPTHPTILIPGFVLEFTPWEYSSFLGRHLVLTTNCPLRSDILLPSKTEFCDHLLCHLQLHSFCRDPVLNMVFSMCFCSYVFISHLNCKLSKGKTYVSCRVSDWPLTPFVPQ